MRFVVDWCASFLWRRKFQQNLQRLKEQSPSILACDEEALWLRIANCLDQESPQPQRASSRLWPRYFFAAAAVILVVCLPFGMTHRQDQSLKAPRETLVLPPTTLSFAVLRADGSVARGREGAQLRKGEAVIFYVETPGLKEGSSFKLDVYFKSPDNHAEIIVEQYSITNTADTLKGPAGYILFEPEAPGVYHFHGLRTYSANQDRVDGFSVEKSP